MGCCRSCMSATSFDSDTVLQKFVSVQLFNKPKSIKLFNFASTYEMKQTFKCLMALSSSFMNSLLTSFPCFSSFN